jgi:hypothetical protein
MSVLEDNSISFEGTQGQLFSITPNLSTGYIYSVNDITGIPLLRANANANITANEYAGNFGIGLTNPGYKLHVLGSVGFTSTTASTSTTTGTLVVSGGVGIGGSLYVASATGISGVTINNGVVTGNLTGTATTAGFATTASYSHQAGYAITSGSASIATTATYSHQAGYAITSGSASIATTATYSHQAGYAITSGSASIATTATYSHQSGYGLTSGFATTASYSYQSGYGITSGLATTATYSHQSGYGLTSGFATTASYSYQSGYGITSGLATTATYAHQAGYAITAGSASIATTAYNINVVNATTNSAHPLHFSPSATGSGLATSSNTTLSYNPSSFILSTSGLAITASTASTNSTSGALVVSGGVGIGGSLYVAGDLTINGTTTTINTVTLTVDDKNIELGSVATPSDITAEGGGITLKGASDKSINWYTGTGWSSSESWNLVSGSTYKINNTTVLSNSSIGTGITNSSLTALGTISTGVWAGTLITALYGGTGFNSYTKGDLLVGAGTTLIKHAVGSQNQILIADLFSGSGLSWATFANPTYGSFYSTSTQQVAGAGISTPVKFNSTYESNRVSIYGGSGTSSRIQIQDAGPFSITFSAQINLVSGNTFQNGDFWFRVNGQDVPQSNSSMSISGKDYETLVTVNFVYTFANNDYFEIIMSSLDTQFSIEYQSGLTNPPRPNTPSVILSVLPITHIVGASGSGISGILSLNGSTASQQYFLTGTSGTGFNIQTASGNHTFNIPIAGSGATGLVTGIAQTFEGSKTFSASTIVSSSTASTTTTTGALIVSGGVGIGQSASIGGRLQLFNGANYTSFVSSASGNTVYTLPATSPATGSSVLQSTSAGVMSWVSTSGLGASAGGALDGSVQYKSGSGFGGTRSFFFNTTTNGLRLGNFPGEELPSSTSAALLIEQTIGSFNGSVNGTLIAANAISGFTGDLINLQVNAVTRFRVGADGAIGTSSGFNAGGDISVTSGTNSSSTTSGALQVRGGLGITGNAFIGGTTTITNTTASVNSSSGALVVSGGVGIGQTLFIGGNLYQNSNAITAFDTGFRNRIINGDGFIDQRSDGSSTTPGVGATTFIDRWKMNVFGSGRLTIGKNYGGITSPDGFVSYIGMKTTTTTTPGANDYNFLSQVIEGVNTIDLQWGTANAKPIALSFWAYSSLTGTFGGSVRNAGSGAYNRSYPFTYTISSSNTWEKKTVVIPGDTTGTWTTNHLNGIEIIFVVSNGTTWQATPFAWAAGNYTGPSGSLANLIGTLNATLYLTGIQAEIGSVATPYERRNYGHEFSLCQRYYQITEVRVGGYHTTGGGLRGSAYLNTAMRPITSPVLTVLATDESSNLGSLNVDTSNFRGDSYRYIVSVTAAGDAYGQWKVSADCEF